MARLLTAAQFGRLPPTDTVQELVRGRIVERPLRGARYGHVCRGLMDVLNEYTDRAGGCVFAVHGVVTGYDPDTVRAVDVSYYTGGQARLARLLERDEYPTTAPTLAMLVPPSEDPWTRTVEPVVELLLAGAGAVGVLDPEAFSVTVYRSVAGPRVFAADAELTVPDVLPGFAVPVARLFG